MAPEQNNPANNKGSANGDNRSPARQGDTNAGSMSSFNSTSAMSQQPIDTQDTASASASRQALRIQARELAETTPAELNEQQVSMLEEEELTSATDIILDNIQGREATAQEVTVLNYLTDAVSWMEAANINIEAQNREISAATQATRIRQERIRRALSGEDSSDEEN